MTSTPNRQLSRVCGNALKGIAFVVLLLFGALSGDDALANGTLSLSAIVGFAGAALLFSVGDKLNPTFC
jgi:hypothetical protein